MPLARHFCGKKLLIRTRTRARTRNRLFNFSEYDYEYENRPARAGLSTISSLEVQYLCCAASHLPYTFNLTPYTFTRIMREQERNCLI